MTKANKIEPSPVAQQVDSDWDGPDLSPEAMAKSSQITKHLEEGYVPTSSLFPGTGL